MNSQYILITGAHSLSDSRHSFKLMLPEWTDEAELNSIATDLFDIFYIETLDKDIFWGHPARQIRVVYMDNERLFQVVPPQ